MKRSLFCLVAVVVATTASFSQIPRTISYQGIFSDSLGNPLPDDEHVFGFSLFDDSIGGNQLWFEQHVVQVRRGLISAVLGSTHPFPDSAKFDRPYWLEITCDRCGPMSPRLPLTAVGYSLNSVRSDTARFAIVAVDSSPCI